MYGCGLSCPEVLSPMQLCAVFRLELLFESSRCLRCAIFSSRRGYLRAPLAFDFAAPAEVSLLVCINSPMYLWSSLVAAQLCRMGVTYDCRKRLPPSSFSCSDLTVSTRSQISSRLAWRALACLGGTIVSNGHHAVFGEKTYSMSASLAESPILSISSLLLLGLIVLASFSSYSSSSSRISMFGDSRGIMMVPEDLRLGSFGRCRRSTAFAASSSLTEEDDDEGLSSTISSAGACVGGSTLRVMVVVL